MPGFFRPSNIALRRKSADTHLPLIVDNIMRTAAYPEKKQRSSRMEGGHKMPAKIKWKDWQSGKTD
ncbi:MAG: hypothetical protein MUO63_00315 [Desulfobulbaceae bacterium]|nr:hypothetical protein [Desulfobulbaceae bacterium]